MKEYITGEKFIVTIILNAELLFASQQLKNTDYDPHAIIKCSQSNIARQSPDPKYLRRTKH